MAAHPVSREARKRKAKRAERLEARRVLATGRNDDLMRKAAEQLDVLQFNLNALQTRVDYYRNLFVASAFSAGLGNERVLTDLVKEAHPELLRLQS